MNRPVQLAVTAAIAVGAVAAYHVVFAPGKVFPGLERALDANAKDVEALTRRVAALESNAGRTSSAMSPAGTPAEKPAGTEPPEAGRAASTAWTESDLVTLRSMLDELERRKRQEQQERQLTAILEKAVPELSGNRLRLFLDSAVRFLEEQRPLTTEMPAARTTEERAEIRKRMDEQAARFADEVKKAYPDLAEKILAAMPWTRAARTPPR